jgi:hypothetical protein
MDSRLVQYLNILESNDAKIITIKKDLKDFARKFNPEKCECLIFHKLSSVEQELYIEHMILRGKIHYMLARVLCQSCDICRDQKIKSWLV